MTVSPLLLILNQITLICQIVHAVSDQLTALINFKKGIYRVFDVE